MTNEQINLDFEEYQKELDIRDLNLKFVVHFKSEEEDDLMKMLKEINQKSIKDCKNPEF